MKENNLESKNGSPEINIHEFNLAGRKKIWVDLGLVIGAVAGSNGTRVLIQKENGEMIIRSIGEVVKSNDPAWTEIDRIARGQRRGKSFTYWNRKGI